jgi:hypothetical protein
MSMNYDIDGLGMRLGKGGRKGAHILMARDMPSTGRALRSSSGVP